MSFRTHIRVYWEDTDAAGIVYYANYLRFLERARTEWLRARGFDQRELAQRLGIAFVVRAIALEFLRPARLDDELAVGVVLAGSSAATIELRQAIERGKEVLVEGNVKLACVRIAAFQPTRIPRELRDAMFGR
jgi:acyl-CoA thioester hydrolase